MLEGSVSEGGSYRARVGAAKRTSALLYWPGEGCASRFRTRITVVENFEVEVAGPPRFTCRNFRSASTSMPARLPA